MWRKSWFGHRKSWFGHGERVVVDTGRRVSFGYGERAVLNMEKEGGVGVAGCGRRGREGMFHLPMVLPLEVCGCRTATAIPEPASSHPKLLHRHPHGTRSEAVQDCCRISVFHKRRSSLQPILAFVGTTSFHSRFGYGEGFTSTLTFAISTAEPSTPDTNLQQSLESQRKQERRKGRHDNRRRYAEARLYPRLHER
jgi:hypothetical protein